MMVGTVWTICWTRPYLQSLSTWSGGVQETVHLHWDIGSNVMSISSVGTSAGRAKYFYNLTRGGERQAHQMHLEIMRRVEI